MPIRLESCRTSSSGAMICAEKDEGLPNDEKTMAVLAQTGAVLLRGFPFDSDSFVTFSDRCCVSFSTYAGGAFRFRSLDRIDLGANGTLLSTTGSKQTFAIPLHGEMYYQRQRPDTIWFFCKRAPEALGQTIIADGREIFEALPARSKALLRSSRLRYIRELGPNDWPTTFQTNDLEELLRICDEGGANLTIRLDNSIRIEFACSALVSGNDGHEIFINNLISVWRFEQDLRSGATGAALGSDVSKRPPLAVRLEDGCNPPEWLTTDIEKASAALTTEIAWQNGDVLVLDNRRILHGRRKASGDNREILVRLGNLHDHVSS
jgi:alpha-ketoglutarate-dependent taurine dioxygenase